MKNRAVVERLKEFGATRGEFRLERFGLRDGATRSERTRWRFFSPWPFDQGMPWQKAWRIPVEIDKAGCLDPARLASMSETGPDQVGRRLGHPSEIRCKARCQNLVGCGAPRLRAIRRRRRRYLERRISGGGGEDTAGDPWARDGDRLHGHAHPPRRLRLFQGTGAADRREAGRSSCTRIPSRRVRSKVTPRTKRFGPLGGWKSGVSRPTGLAGVADRTTMVPRDRTGLWSLPVDAGLRQTGSDLQQTGMDVVQ